MHDVLSRFTARGLAEFTRWIQHGAPSTIPRELLESAEFAEKITGGKRPPEQQFSDRYEFGAALVQLLSDLDQQQVSFDRGLWSWLAAYYFEQLAPKDADGKRVTLRKEYVYTLSEPRIYYRHLARTPWFLVKTHGERCKYLLVSRPGDPAPLSRQSYLLDQLAARQFVIASPALVGAAAYLYSDRRTGQPTRGAGAKGSGSPRRLALIANQLSLTFDIHDMPPERLLLLLPEEFGARRRPTPITPA
jgi:hypothetical protein